MSPAYLLITASYILLVFAGLHFLKKHDKPDWWMGPILAVYTACVFGFLKTF